jgi:hypothetical protein
MRGAAQGSRVEKAGLTSHICHENYDEGYRRRTEVNVVDVCGQR